MDDYDEYENEQEFAPGLEKRIVERVAAGIAAMRDPTIVPPPPEAYLNGDILVDDEPKSLMVDVKIDHMRLRLHARHRHFGSAPLDDGAELAGMIVARVAEYARHRRSHANGLASLKEGIEGKLARDCLGMTLVGVGTFPMPVEESIAGCKLLMSAEIRMLDATLKPYSRWFSAWNAREAAAEINELASSQRRRRRTRERLARIGAVLEIDAVAERAIAAAGRDVTDVVDILMTFHRRDECEHPYQLRASGGGVGVMALIQDGCVVAQLEVPGKVITRGARLQLYHAVPQTTALAALGRPATDVVDLDALRGVATIVKQVVVEETERTYFDMRIARRPLFAQDIGR